MAAYLPPPTPAAAKTATHEANSTYAKLLWKAYRSVNREDLAEKFVAPPEPDPPGIPWSPGKIRGATGVQRQFRITDAQHEWLDDQVDQLGAPSRSAPIATVVGMHLGTHE